MVAHRTLKFWPTAPWRQSWQAIPLNAPRHLWPWLTDAQSLTARISLRCQAFAVRVLFATPRCFEDERRLVGLGRGRRTWARDVLLLADGVPVVFAHSIAAPDSLRGAWHMARGVGTKPLGATLFADPQIVRGALSCRLLHRHHPLFRHVQTHFTTPLPPLWARRSLFRRQSKPLLVTEVFLPSINALPC